MTKPGAMAARKVKEENEPLDDLEQTDAGANNQPLLNSGLKANLNRFNRSRHPGLGTEAHQNRECATVT